MPTPGSGKTNQTRELFYKRLCVLLTVLVLGVVFGGLARKWLSAVRPKPPSPETHAGRTDPVCPGAAANAPVVTPLPQTDQPVSKQPFSVLVVDVSGQPIGGVPVLAQIAFWPTGSSKPSANRPGETKPGETKIGELGVVPGALPFPEEVISGQARLAGPYKPGQAPGGHLARTDTDGVARFASLPTGRWLLLSQWQGKSASAEVVLHQMTAAPSVQVVLHLQTPPLCPDAPDETLGNPDDLLESGVLGQRQDLHGRVLDHRGLAVPQAQIVATVVRGLAGGGTSGAPRRQTTSDARGQFVLPLVPLQPVLVRVQKTGFAPVSHTAPPDKLHEELRLELRPGGGLSGQVEDVRTTGVPEGFALWLVGPAPTGERWPLALSPEGHFSQTGLPPGTYVLTARARGFASFEKTVLLPEAASPDEITVFDVRVRLQKGGRVRGQVRLDGRPANGAEVVVAQPDGRIVAQGRADQRGDYELGELPQGPLRVTGRMQGRSASKEVVMQAGGVVGVDLDVD